jgi:hypothetical protein
VHVLQVVDRFERAVFPAIVDDGLRLGRADALETVELLLRSGIDVDLGTGQAGPQQAGNGQGQES